MVMWKSDMMGLARRHERLASLRLLVGVRMAHCWVMRLMRDVTAFREAVVFASVTAKGRGTRHNAQNHQDDQVPACPPKKGEEIVLAVPVEHRPLTVTSAG